MNPFRTRRGLLAKALGNQPALIFSGAPRPRNYAANHYPHRASSHFLYVTGEHLAHAAVLLAGDTATLFVQRPTTDDALWHGAGSSSGALAERSGCAVRFTDELPAVLAKARVGSLPAFDGDTVAWQRTLLGRNVDVAAPTDADARVMDAFIAARLIHDEHALLEMRTAAIATAEAHAAGMAATRPGVTDWQVQAAMESVFAKRGMPTAYPSIVTPAGEVLHGHATGMVLPSDGLMLADVGGESLGGFASDVTRTWPATGRFSPTQRAVYDIVLAAQLAAIECVRPGMRYRDVHLTASKVIAEGLVSLGILRGDADELVADGVHALFFPHGVGHLIGLDVHDMEDLGDRAGYAEGRTRSTQFGLGYLRLDRDLVPDMAVTIEPGIYFVPAILDDDSLTRVAGDRLVRARLADFADVRGIRIEDDVRVTTGAPEVLSAAVPKTAAAVEAAVGKS